MHFFFLFSLPISLARIGHWKGRESRLGNREAGGEGIRSQPRGNNPVSRIDGSILKKTLLKVVFFMRVCAKFVFYYKPTVDSIQNQPKVFFHPKQEASRPPFSLNKHTLNLLNFENSSVSKLLHIHISNQAATAVISVNKRYYSNCCNAFGLIAL